MAQKLQPGLYRVREGAVVSGVCTGLEACGKGGKHAWRAAFTAGAFIFVLPLFAYICMALFLPLVKTRKEAEEANSAQGVTGANIFNSSPTKISDIEEELQKLTDMKAKGLIDEDEYKQLRKKALGL